MEWTDFIAEAQQSQVVVATGELSPHGSIILEVGVDQQEGGGGGTGGTSPTTVRTTTLAPGGTGVYFFKVEEGFGFTSTFVYEGPR